MRLKHPVVHGHPLHAMLSDLPVGLIPSALLASLVERVSPRPETRFATSAATVLALASATTTLAVGWWDWLTVPVDHPVSRPATTHGLLNTAGLVIGLTALAAPRRRLELLVGWNALLLVAAWIGGDLVYKLGWRVRPAEELEQLDAGRTRSEAREVIDKHEREDTLLA